MNSSRFGRGKSTKQLLIKTSKRSQSPSSTLWFDIMSDPSSVEQNCLRGKETLQKNDRWSCNPALYGEIYKKAGGSIYSLTDQKNGYLV
jgi:hypothetical protein